ncbi:MAG: peptide deformylase [candidate division KSB1 bacterium]|nr:peptide deformylase [candidate division KSB1 bacterium]
MVLKLRYYGDPVLRRPTTNVDLAELRSEAFQAFLDDLVETMHAEDGVGLAAPQVGSDKRVCVASDGEKVHVLINPRIRGRSIQMEEDAEGCLSLPGLQAQVPRHTRVIVEALDPQGNPLELRAKGLFARVLQHEIDHLNGVLYIDRAEPGTLVWLRKDERDTIEKVPAQLAEVKRAFATRYHEGKKLAELVFDPPRITATTASHGGSDERGG